MDFTKLAEAAVATLLFTAIGLILFALAFWLMNKLAPFPLRKEIETDQNVAVAVLMASVVIGISIIVAAAMTG